MSQAIKIAVLVSGSGTNLQAIIDNIEAKKLDAIITLVIANKPEAQALVRAANAGIATILIPHADYPDRESHDQAMLAALEKSGCEYVILAGYMRLLSPLFLETWAGRILNIHPALLPAFPGTHAIRDALDYGVKIIGVTVHFVEEKMDSGPIIIQAAMAAAPETSRETVSNSFHALEHRIYPQAIQWLAEARLTLADRKVLLAKKNGTNPVIIPGALISPPLEEDFLISTN